MKLRLTAFLHFIHFIVLQTDTGMDLTKISLHDMNLHKTSHIIRQMGKF